MSTLKNILEQRGMPCCNGCGMRMKMMEGTCPDCGVNYGLSMGAKNAPSMSEEKEEEPTSDYKLDKAGKKIKASKIVFNTGEDDSTKRVQETMKTTYKDMMTAYSEMRAESLHLEDEINEVLSKDAAAAEWISDFVHSDNPKFAGKSKEKRKQMALAAYYAKQKNEEVVAEAIDAEHYHATSEPSQFGGHRPKVVHKGKGTTMYVGQQGYKTKEAARAGASAYLNAYEKIGDHAASRAAAAHAKNHPDAIKEEIELDEADKISTAQMGHAGKTTIKHIKNPDVTQRMAAHDVKSYADRIALLKDAKRKGNLKENEMEESIKWNDGTSTYHDVKKTSTGTVYTKQFTKDGISKGTGDDAAKKSEGAAKRGRGRPKKDKFAESVEILMSLSEEQFDSMMEEGFDAFFEAFEQLDELNKDTIYSYVTKSEKDLGKKHKELGSQIKADKSVAANKTASKIGNRQAGLDRAEDRLNK